MKATLVLFSVLATALALPTPQTQAPGVANGNGAGNAQKLAEAQKQLTAAQTKHAADECQIYIYERQSQAAPLNKTDQGKLETARRQDLEDHKILNRIESDVQKFGGPKVAKVHSETIPSTSLGPDAKITKSRCSERDLAAHPVVGGSTTPSTGKPAVGGTTQPTNGKAAPPANGKPSQPGTTGSGRVG